MTKSMYSQQNAFLRKMSTSSAMKTINQGPDGVDKNKAMADLQANKTYFTQLRNNSVADVRVDDLEAAYGSSPGKNNSIDMLKSIKGKMVTPTNNAESLGTINIVGEDDVVEINAGEQSPGAGVARGGRGRSPTQPKQKFSTIQIADRKSYQMINRGAHKFANEATLFDD